MSYKKFTRNHGKTSRVKKYKWSNPDHRYSDSKCSGQRGLAFLGHPELTIVIRMFRGGVNGGGGKSTWARLDHRKIRRKMKTVLR